MIKQGVIGLVVLLVSSISFAQESITIPMHLVIPGQKISVIGTVTAQQTPWGVLFTPKLRDLPPGVHGFHVHTVASCADNGLAAGGHFDPKKTGKHRGPYNTKGHLGDLPVLNVAANGKATLPMLAPRLKLADLKNHALMVHLHGDNYADVPKKLGGGGQRIACGVIN